MNKNNRRLFEIAGLLDEISEQMKADNFAVMEELHSDSSTDEIIGFYVEEIEELTKEMKGLLDLNSI